MVLEGQSAATSQAPGSADTALQLEFGAAQFGPGDPVQMSAAGLVTFNEAGLYRIRVFGQVEHPTGGVNEANIFLRPLLNGAQAGRSFNYLLLPDTRDQHEQESWFYFNEGDEFTYEVIRDSVPAATSGGLFKVSPTAGGWNDSPCAAIEVSRFVPLSP